MTLGGQYAELYTIQASQYDTSVPWAKPAASAEAR
jgi:hypothetical protein